MAKNAQNNYDLSEAKYKELLLEIEAKWKENDPNTHEFVDKIQKLRKRNKIKQAATVAEEFLIKLTAEYLSRITKS